MASFKLTIMTPEKVFFDGEASRVTVRTTEGDVSILKNHADYVAALSVGVMRIQLSDGERKAAVAGGLIRVDKEETTILSDACEWADEIDLARAKAAEQRAREMMEKSRDKRELDFAEAKLKRALTRISLAGE